MNAKERQLLIEQVVLTTLELKPSMVNPEKLRHLAAYFDLLLFEKEGATA